MNTKINISESFVPFQVIPNGCSVEKMPCQKNVRALYGIAPDDYVFVFVGNVGIRKNQIQVVRAFRLLSREEQRRMKILFVGGNESELKASIDDNGMAGNLIVCGSVPKNEVPDYYYSADATILTSISEGFGLSIIEGFVYGKPSLTFADLPAVPDLYDEQAMILIQDRSDKSVAEGMRAMVRRNWDSQWIGNYAHNFSFDVMAKNYVDFYKSILQARQ